MTGNVTTENNGGFIQIRTNLKPLQLKLMNMKGISIKDIWKQ